MQVNAMRSFPRTTAFKLSVVNLVDDGLSLEKKTLTPKLKSSYHITKDITKSLLKDVPLVSVMCK